MVEVKNLVKRYGDKLAVDDVSFTVDSGEILGFLGPNGAGKTTTMNIITGYLSSTSGTVTIDGCEILEDPTGAKSKIGYLPEIPPLYPDMIVRKYLEFMFDLKKVTLPKKEHIEEVCKVARITDVAGRLIKNLSKGYKQRVGLAQALLGNPPVLILDEPTVGLDPKQIIEMRTLIKGLGKKHTVILSSHVLPEVQATCDRVIVINQGKLVADSATSALSDTLSGTHNLLVQIAGNETAVMSAIRNISGVLKMERLRSISSDCTEYVIKTEKDKDVRRQIFFAMAKAEYPIVLMKNAELSLEDAFLQLTGNSNVAGKKGGKWS
ncbi:MAG TPA: ATP-binding cassette domain-containing protein [Candidatus Scatavimonas merdigallinarum]|uniref:ATP-binding cassette domain-containing protein n=1 Tax=Candidatus Scatavimonas merdigallinarum TaxID=2840914 RepID=A0A9D0ZGT5_9FIRM|nr:ATP-binding cassette domain-containing protein [Candidatus Scatavimonas merdigallinarum]